MNGDAEEYYLVKVFHDIRCQYYKDGVSYDSGMSIDFKAIVIFLN